MAHIKAKLTQAGFPFNFREIAGTVLAPNYLDQNLQASGEQVALEVPQAYFMQNVLPTARGLQSAHYARVLKPHTYPTYLEEVHTLRDASGSVALFSPAGGQNLIYTKSTGAWTAFPLPDGVLPSPVTVAHLKGVSYVCYEGTGVFTYDFTTDTFAQVTLLGVAPADVLGVCAANQYLLLYTGQYVAWSNPLNPLDFVPVVGGAGQSAILANRSEIVVCLPVTEGFIVYTGYNAIFGSYSGNPNVPFYFREIPNSAGIASPEHATGESTGSGHVAWTSSGFMQVASKQAQLIWPELSSAIADGLYSLQGSSDYPIMMHKSSLEVKVSTVGSRYYVVSVKDRASTSKDFPVAYVYDLALDRWGRLDIPHIDFFEYRAPEFVAAITYDMATYTYDEYTVSYNEALTSDPSKVSSFGTTFGCSNSLGAVHIVLGSQTKNLELLESASSGAATPKVYLGKYRVVRPTAVKWNQLQLSTEALEATLSVYAHSLSGEVIRKLVPVASGRSEGKWVGQLSGASISIKVEGKFLLTSLEFELLDAGSKLQPESSERLPADLVTVSGIPVIVSGAYITTESAP